MQILALADDLSGANEVAAILAGLPDRSRAVDAQDARSARPRSTTVHLGFSVASAGAAEVTVVDTDNRRRTGAQAAEHLRRMLTSTPGVAEAVGLLFLKFDSLLRGNIGQQLQAAQEVAPVLFCPAVPGLGRTVREGVLRIDGCPLHQSGLWNAEAHPPASTVAAQLSPAPTRTLDVETVRGAHLKAALSQAAEAGAVAVCDAESPADLERLAAVGLELGFVLAGAAGLAAAAAARLPAGSTPTAVTGTHPDRRETLFILGTASAAARRQADRLEASGVPVHRLRPEQIDGFPLEHDGTVAVTVDGPVDPSHSTTVTTALTGLAMRHHADRHLVLSGGETAQAVLAALHISELVPLIQAHPGAVVSAAAGGRLVTTRPGSYGAPTSLLDILTTMNLLQDTTRKVPS
ncbi:four-carbon acid sugar kinase family protein [Kocuria sp. NPDC057446]|uniref:four-carbon acid sugar kinase family protein n=1 Tax=Kocuria sp. NPDC057446 TaxID=3346137 RepID=UPI003683189E